MVPKVRSTMPMVIGAFVVLTGCAVMGIIIFVLPYDEKATFQGVVGFGLGANLAMRLGIVVDFQFWRGYAYFSHKTLLVIYGCLGVGSVLSLGSIISWGDSAAPRFAAINLAVFVLAMLLLAAGIVHAKKES